jgi:hypothetical protein
VTRSTSGVSWAIENCTVQQTPNCDDQSGGGTRKKAISHLGFYKSGPSDWMGGMAVLKLFIRECDWRQFGIGESFGQWGEVVLKLVL